MSTANTASGVSARTTASARWNAAVARLGDYLELTKPRIVVLELCVAAAAAHVAAPHSLAAWTLVNALAATALVAGSASIANQWLEREVDRRMRRTAGRPLAAGRVTGAESVALSLASLAAGSAWLLFQVNWLTAALGLASWVMYVAVYTPLKTRSTLNTAVGAVAGAIPVLMGWTATGPPARSHGLVACRRVVPMAVSALHGHRLAAPSRLCRRRPSNAARRRSHRRTRGAQAVTAALALLPVSLIPALSPASGSPLVYSLWAIALGGAQLALAIRFALISDEPSARKLLRGTLVYLPTWLAVLLMVAA